jgi:hypothetical protein
MRVREWISEHAHQHRTEYVGSEPTEAVAGWAETVPVFRHYFGNVRGEYSIDVRSGAVEDAVRIMAADVHCGNVATRHAIATTLGCNAAADLMDVLTDTD